MSLYNSIVSKFPLKKYIISGDSMKPTFFHGDSVLLFPYFLKKPRVGDIVVIDKANGIIIKRIQKIKEDTYFVVGDNAKESTDSKIFGFINRRDIIGRVIMKL